LRERKRKRERQAEGSAEASHADGIRRCGRGHGQ